MQTTAKCSWTCQFVPARQGIALKGEKKLLSDGATLSSVGWKEGGELAVKDLGAQISWTTVFVVEYVSPRTARLRVQLLIHLRTDRAPHCASPDVPLPEALLRSRCPAQLPAEVRRVCSRDVTASDPASRYVYAMVMAHFLKREYESLFVHRYSHGTMPFAYVFRKYVYSPPSSDKRLTRPQLVPLSRPRRRGARVLGLQPDVLRHFGVHPGHDPREPAVPARLRGRLAGESACPPLPPPVALTARSGLSCRTSRRT